MKNKTLQFLQIAAAVVLLSAALSVQATVIWVSALADDITDNGNCTLREAIQAANTDQAVDDCPAGDGADVIALQPSSLYAINIFGRNEDGNQTGDFDLDSEITINGKNNTLVSGSAIDRVFDVLPDAVVTLNGLQIRDGKPDGPGGGVYSSGILNMNNCDVSLNQGVSGGGVNSGGLTTIDHSVIHDNEAAASGGGVTHSAGYKLTLIESTISNNVAGFGGGLRVTSLDMQRSTINNNHASANGGGIWKLTGTPFDSIVNSSISHNTADGDGGGLYIEDYSRVVLASSTVAFNSADYDDTGGGDGGGIVVLGDNGVVKLANTIIAENQDGSTGNFAPYIPDCRGNIESLGYNLLGALNPGGTICSISGDISGNLTGLVGDRVVPLMFNLGDNGGPTFTHAFLSSSPAIDAGNPNGCEDGAGNLLITDQRLLERTSDGPDPDKIARCDIGAFEFGAGPLNVIFKNGFE